MLSVVLLGLCNSLKEDLDTSSAEVYGFRLKLPGEYFIPDDVSQDPFPFLEHLRESMRKIRPQ